LVAKFLSRETLKVFVRCGRRFRADCGDALQVAVQPGRRFDDATNLFFALRPQPHHRLAFAVEVGLHVAEDDGLDPVPESRAGQVLVDLW
jgi:hypothetical protein